MKKEQRAIEKELQLLRRINIRIFDVDHRAFLESERKIEDIIKWAKTPKEKRKPAVHKWTASPQRQLGYLIENLEFELKKCREEQQKETEAGK